MLRNNIIWKFSLCDVHTPRNEGSRLQMDLSDTTSFLKCADNRQVNGAIRKDFI